MPGARRDQRRAGGRSTPWRAGLPAAIAVVAALAALAAVLSAYRPSLSPPGLHPREVQFAVAQGEALIDTPQSQLVDRQEDFYRVLTPQIAVTEALYLKTDGVLQAAARAAGIPGQEVTAAGPFTLLLGRTNLPSKVPPISASPRINPNYRLLVDVDGSNPMVTLYAQAPTVRAARAIVQSARALLATQVARQERTFALPEATRVLVRPLGAVTAAVVDPQARPELMALIFVIVALLAGAAAVTLSRRLSPPPAARARVPRTHHALWRATPEPGGLWPRTTRLLPWSMAVFMAMIFVVPIDQMTLPVHLPLAGNPDRALLIVIAGVWLISLTLGPRRARPRVRLGAAHFAALLFLAVAFLGVAANGHELASFQEVGPTTKKLVLLASFVLFFVIASSALRPGEIPRLVTLMIGLGVVVAVAAIVEAKTHYNVFYSLWPKVFSVSLPAQLDQADNIGRLTVDGPTSEPLELAAMLAMVLPFAILRGIEAPERRERLRYAAAATILLAGAIATQRKTSIVAPLAGLLVLLAYRPRIIRSLLVASLPLFVAVHVLAPGQIGSVFAQLLPGHASTVLTTTDRVARYDAVRPDIMSHLALGRGFQSYDPIKYRILDNEYLGLLIGVGVIGTAVYLLIFWGLLRAGHRTVRGRDAARIRTALPAMAAIVIALVSNALFDVLSFPHVSYLFFFIGAMTLTLSAPETPERVSRPSLRLAPAGSGPARRAPAAGREPAAPVLS